MKRSIAVAFATVLFAIAAVAAPSDEPGVVRVGVKGALERGRQQVTLSVYATREGGVPLASETRAVEVDANGAFKAPLGSLAALASGNQERWLGVHVSGRAEASRVRLVTNGSLPITVLVVTDAAITANGFVESISQGFRFPDGSVQTTAATVTGGVPSVNGIASAVTIQGAATVSVGTAGGTITVTGPSFGSPVSVASANADGAASTVARSDHAHAHGNQAGGTLHSAATTGTAGFLSASDKTKLDGTVAYVRTIVVSPVVGSATSSGTALVNALNGISGNSSTDPYLLKIEPGVYDIGNNGLTMKSYVDIEGSGENATFITATRGNSGGVTSTAAAVIGAANSELRNLTVTNTSAANYGAGFYSIGVGTRRISNVTINSTGALTSSIGVYVTTSTTLNAYRATVTATGVGGTTSAIGLLGSTGTTIGILNSTITGKGAGGTGVNYGVESVHSTCVMTIDSSTIIGTGTSNGNIGVYVSTGTVTVTNSTMRVDTAGTVQAVATSASASSILNVSHSLLMAGVSTNSSQVSINKGSGSMLRVATSMVDSASNGAPTCVYNYDSTFAALGTSCPGPIG